mmetsp:Transcript_69758/g.199937  ORF Transcript_69758/g.199937 Transcript_69758/m.199937 type:complete len:269 (+) Transcript_69758:1000-1806(+)
MTIVVQHGCLQRTRPPVLEPRLEGDAAAPPEVEVVRRSAAQYILAVDENVLAYFLALLRILHNESEASLRVPLPNAPLKLGRCGRCRRRRRCRRRQRRRQRRRHRRCKRDLAIDRVSVAAVWQERRWRGRPQANVQSLRHLVHIRDNFFNVPSSQCKLAGLRWKLCERIDSFFREAQLPRQAVAQALDFVPGLNEFRRDEGTELDHSRLGFDVQVLLKDVGNEHGSLKLQLAQVDDRKLAHGIPVLDDVQAHVQPDDVAQLGQAVLLR